ncbi:unnamed protein product [Somion occarium]|uniref:SET domain-containing protein n=1 Tax=Somion occarium TaxID=3059160 RepID=A0ABP1DKR1_9APHY
MASHVVYVPEGTADQDDILEAHNNEVNLQLEGEILQDQQRQEVIRKRTWEVYKDVWDQFYNWEPGACEQTIVSLAAVSPYEERHSDDEYLFDEPGHDSDISDRMDVDSLSYPSEDSFTVRDFETGRPETMVCSTFKIKHCDPYPRYFACTPSSCNILSTHDYRICRFIPFGGEPGFNELEYIGMEEFESFQWQDHWRDPDEYVIAATVIKQLTEDKNQDNFVERITYEDIDKYLPFTCGEVLYEMSQRDSLLWPGSVTFGEIADNSRPQIQSSEKSLFNQVINNMQQHFCPYIDCIRPLCILHAISPWEPHHPQPSITSTEIAEGVTKPCGPSCFKTKKNLDQITLSNQISQVVHDTVTLAPDGPSCDLSVICKRPCYEIYLYRSKLFKDDDILLERNRLIPKIKKPQKFVDYNDEVTNFTMKDPCTHKGPCSTTCPCFLANMHCSRNCFCKLSCPLRPSGCTCYKSKNCKETIERKAQCKCVKNNWECDPELCRLVVGVKNKQQRKKYDDPQSGCIHGCANTVLQKGLLPATEVKQGSFGLGVFAMQKIKKFNFLGEYTAESFWRHDVTHEPIWSYTGLNYNFGLNSSQNLDAITVGNVTRYFNHSVTPNVLANTLVVNGEHRIAFYAARDIKKGEELLFNYGDQYWQQSH